ncbi:hypothetical protein HMPREF9526_02859 [Enterococcus faecium TX0133B]|nr:hypothetical protein [Enterococcus faecium]EFR70142.1 hypothetical protein HMPREF9526_02859 [Enterococcus faecium TX0133B]
MVGSQPLDKRYSKASFSVLSQIYAKMWKAIFTKFFLILETKRLFQNLLVNGVQKLASAVISQPIQKQEKLFLLGYSYYLLQGSFFTTSPLNGVQSADPRY